MTKVLLPDAMTRFKCNQKGCCCKGWVIAFEAQDLMPLITAFPEESRPELIENWKFWVDDDKELRKFQFGLTGPEQACEFLADSGSCGLQLELGAEVLPHLCRAFPAFSFQIAGSEELELHYDAICPEVLNQIDEGDGPLALSYVEAARGSDLEVRARRPVAIPSISLGEQELSVDQLRFVRARILETLADPCRPAIDQLALIQYALARVAHGASPETFAVLEADPTGPFDAYLDECVSIHQDRLVSTFFREYRRFVFDISLEDVDWEALTGCMVHDPGWRERLDPRDPGLQTLLARFLSHRFFSPFDRSPVANRLTFSYGTVTHSLATSFRIAVGLSKWLDRPVDRALMKVALGASEYFYRSLRTPPSSMPWFLLPEPV